MTSQHLPKHIHSSSSAVNSQGNHPHTHSFTREEVEKEKQIAGEELKLYADLHCNATHDTEAEFEDPMNPVSILFSHDDYIDSMYKSQQLNKLLHLRAINELGYKEVDIGNVDQR